MSERTVPVEILLDTSVNGIAYTKGQQGVKLTPFEAEISVRDKAARIIGEPATAETPAPKPARKAATKKSARKR